MQEPCRLRPVKEQKLWVSLVWTLGAVSLPCKSSLELPVMLHIDKDRQAMHYGLGLSASVEPGPRTRRQPDASRTKGMPNLQS